MPGTVADAPTIPASFANNFWGKEDAGVQPLLERMHGAKVTCDELKAFYNARASIEDEYSKKLAALARKPLGSCESGTMRASLDVVRGEVESMAKSHQGIAAQMKSEAEEPLAAFAGGLKERRKIVQSGIEKLFKLKTQQTQTVNKSRDRYEQDCLKIKGYLAQGHMVMGQEERKNKAKMEKTQIQLASTSNEYEAAVKALEETTGRWNRDWKAACDKFQDLEEERLDYTKSSLWTFVNVASTVCVSDDASCEKIRLALEKLEIENEIATFIQDQGTGQEIPDPPKYINFCRGDVDDTASEVSEAESYSVAQFQRTMNPAFRTSSPQPSTFESHHDPNSYQPPVRKPHPDIYTPPSRETTLTPQRSSQQPPPQLDYHTLPPSKPLQRMNADDFAPVPHNEFPADGMTMFCRTNAPPSERSSVVSPVRPSSRDSHSDYSNPTSMSSIDPASGKQSPTKQINGSNVSSNSPEKSIQKKRSGFFSNSPFRRKSKHEKEGRPAHQSRSSVAAPASSATWGPSSGREAQNRSPTRPFGSGNSRHRMDHSVSPEPVDPRASFQLNVGNNVFDVASPDADRNRNKPSPLKSSPQKEIDPIAQALADLKGVGKQSSTRVSADRYHGIATPAPPSASSMQHQADVLAAQRGTPPPSYNGGGSGSSPAKSLTAPQPAFTSAQMRQTTNKYVGQNQSMYGSSRPGTRGSVDVPRATSPLPMRSTSPRPGFDAQQQRGVAPQYRDRQARSASPNPYGGSSPIKPSNGYNNYAAPPPQAGNPGRSSRYNSPSDMRPGSSNGAGGGGQMAMQLADPNQAQQYPQQRGRGQSNAQRPMSYYSGQQQQAQSGPAPPSAGRTRSKSVAGGQYTRDGLPILEFAKAMYPYQKAIPAELSFRKGDILAVLRYQDDGWYEAEVSGGGGGRGLVPSNYLGKLNELEFCGYCC